MKLLYRKEYVLSLFYQTAILTDTPEKNAVAEEQSKKKRNTKPQTPPKKAKAPTVRRLAKKKKVIKQTEIKQ